jgi:uncharacterized membrane protein YkoI
MAFGKWRTGKAIAAACGILCLLAAIALLFATRESRAEGLTLEKARGVVLEQYGGEIVSSSARDGGYLLQLKTEQGLYEVTVGGKSADLTGIRLIERYEDQGAGGTPTPAESPLPTADEGTSLTPSPSPTEAPAVTPPPPPSKPGASEQPSSGTPGSGGKPASSVHISEDRAASLALAKVAGRVTDVEKEDDDGVWYYYVDIETEDGREAEVQLNAASGAVVTVAWDDDDDD